MRLGRLLLGTVYVSAGTLHFLIPAAYERIVPTYLPRHHLLVVISGAAEIACGLGILAPQTRPDTQPSELASQPGRAAAWGLVALLLAVFPANLAMVTEHFRFPGVPLWAAWARLPLQLPLLWWAWRYTRLASWREGPAQSAR